MTGLHAFHLNKESETLVRNKHAVIGRKSTSYGCEAVLARGEKTHGAERTGNVLFKHLHGCLIEEDTFIGQQRLHFKAVILYVLRKKVISDITVRRLMHRLLNKSKSA